MTAQEHSQTWNPAGTPKFEKKTARGGARYSNVSVSKKSARRTERASQSDREKR